VDKEDAGTWVTRLAEQVVCEVFAQMAGVSLRRQRDGQPSAAEMDMVYGQVWGDCSMRVQLCAQPRTFYRLAQGILGVEPGGQEEVRECAVECFNVLCGRFVSEIFRMTESKARFDPPKYRAYRDGLEAAADEPLKTLYFATENGEWAEFSWSRNAMDELLRRSGLQ
jgi:hypothetical protein